MFPKSSISVLVFICATMCIAVSSTPAKKRFPRDLSFLDSSSTCGGVLRASSGIISYKTLEPVQPNERCVWTIRAPLATSYSVSILSLGIPSSVIVSGFKLGGPANHTTPTSIGPIATTLATSNILVITFYTGPTSGSSNNLGFSLTYSSSTSGDNKPVSSTSEYVIAATGFGHVKYPSGTSAYNNNELSTVVATPIIGLNGKFKNSKLIYIKDSLEGTGCYDKLHVYVFDTKISGGNKWKSLQRICGQVDSQLIANRDLIMVIFESDNSQTYKGFHLYSLVET